jgi:hypothetical protein
MSPASPTSRKKTARKTTKRATPRSMTSAHKQALSEGRALSATVDRYLAAVNTPQRRGRKVSKATLEQRLADARVQSKTAVGVDRVLAAQAVRDLQGKLAQVDSGVDIKSLEASFVKIAKKFSENRGIGYGAWRDAGVPAQVLKRAGITRTRG